MSLSWSLRMASWGQILLYGRAGLSFLVFFDECLSLYVLSPPCLSIPIIQSYKDMNVLSRVCLSVLLKESFTFAIKLLMSLGCILYCRLCIKLKKPRSSTLRSGLFGGCGRPLQMSHPSIAARSRSTVCVASIWMTPTVVFVNPDGFAAIHQGPVLFDCREDFL